MFKFGATPARRAHIDLATVRETLLYMESDCRDCPGLEAVAAALKDTIGEIDRVRGEDNALPQSKVIAANFLPAGL